MPTFQISDPPPTAPLAEATENGRQVAKATVSFVVENKTPVKRAAVARVIPEAQDDPGIYLIEGASSTMTTVRSIDFEPNGSQTVNVMVTVPRTEAAKKGAFRLRVAKDSEGDDDAVDSRPVAFEAAAATAAPPPPKRPFPWWAVIAAAVIVLIGAGAVTWVVWPKYPGLAEIQRETVGKKIGEAIVYLESKGMTPVLAADPTSPREPMIVDKVAVADQEVTLMYDPGVELPILKGEYLSILDNVVPALAGKATIQLVREADDPGACVDLISNQSPQALGNIYKTGTQFFVFWKHGASVDRRCSRLFDVLIPFDLQSYVAAHPDVIVGSQ
jgi:hypothetical protein